MGSQTVLIGETIPALFLLAGVLSAFRSMMYDEFPDQLQLRMMCRRIFRRMEEEEEEEAGEWLMELVQVMTYHELCQRRCEYRNCRRRFY